VRGASPLALAATSACCSETPGASLYGVRLRRVDDRVADDVAVGISGFL
jgi:hypothetical protein